MRPVVSEPGRSAARVLAAVGFAVTVAAARGLVTAAAALAGALLALGLARMPARTVLRRMLPLEIVILALALVLPAGKKGTVPICAKHPPARSGKWGLSPFSSHAGPALAAAIALKANAIVLGLLALLGSMEPPHAGARPGPSPRAAETGPPAAVHGPLPGGAAPRVRAAAGGDEGPRLPPAHEPAHLPSLRLPGRHAAGPQPRPFGADRGGHEVPRVPRAVLPAGPFRFRVPARRAVLRWRPPRCWPRFSLDWSGYERAAGSSFATWISPTARTGRCWRQCNFRLEPGQRLALAGANGSGKTTLLHLIVGLLRPERGADRGLRQAAGGARPISTRSAAAWGCVFQDADDQLFCPTVAEDVAFGPLNLGKPRDEVRQIVADTLDVARAWPATSTASPTGSPAAKSGWWPWPRCWPCGPTCCCWTSRPAAWTSRPARLIGVLAALPHAMIVVSHQPAFRQAVTQARSGFKTAGSRRCDLSCDLQFLLAPPHPPNGRRRRRDGPAFASASRSIPCV